MDEKVINKETEKDIRTQKIEFLGDCLFEYLQRLQHNTKIELSEELLRIKANEFCNVINIHDFEVDKDWINQFRQSYNSLQKCQFKIYPRTRASSLDVPGIMTHCIYMRANLKKRNRPSVAIEKYEKEEPKEEVRRLRKMAILEQSLYEYTKRASYHLKMISDDDTLQKIANELAKILKITFEANRDWLDYYKRNFSNITTTKIPPLTLNLQDIIDYCSEQSGFRTKKRSLYMAIDKAKATNINLINNQQNNTIINEVKNYENTLPIIRIPNDLTISVVPPEENDVENLDNNNILTSSTILKLPTPLKIRKIESLRPQIDATKAAGSFTTTPMASLATITTNDNVIKRIRNYQEALEWLKPLEEFAMLEENFRMIGLITRLEEMLSNPPSNVINS